MLQVLQKSFAQSRDHIVFPVKYRKALLDETVTTIIEETATEIAERFPIEMEAMDMTSITSICSAVRIRK